MEPHTINLALGVWGKTKLLPEPRVLEVTTMCGHHMISKDIAADAMERVKSGATSPEEAAEEIGRLCVCGIFNPKRCGEIFEKLK